MNYKTEIIFYCRVVFLKHGKVNAENLIFLYILISFKDYQLVWFVLFVWPNWQKTTTKNWLFISVVYFSMSYFYARYWLLLLKFCCIKFDMVVAQDVSYWKRMIFVCYFQWVIKLTLIYFFRCPRLVQYFVIP